MRCAGEIMNIFEGLEKGHIEINGDASMRIK
jgi:hypothetical protein